MLQEIFLIRVLLPKHSYYAGFTKQQFAEDDYFREYVLNRNASNELFWNTHMDLNPGVDAIIKAAYSIVLQENYYDRGNKELGEDEIRQLKDNIFRQLQFDTPSRNIAFGPRPKKHLYVAVAASVIVLIVLFGYYNSNSSMPVDEVFQLVQVNQGQTKEVLLPDSSIVILNAHSSLRYRKSFLNQSAREVFLKGNAFFKIRKNNISNRFLVQAGDLTVEVHGTEFNVNARSEDVEVVLTKGSIKLTPKTDPKLTAFMQPGDKFKLNASSYQFIKSSMNAHLYAAWTDDKWIFDKTSLAQIAVLVKEYYNEEIEFSDAADKDLTISAVIPVSSLEKLVEIIQETLSIHLYTSNNKLIVH